METIKVTGPNDLTIDNGVLNKFLLAFETELKKVTTIPDDHEGYFRVSIDYA